MTKKVFLVSKKIWDSVYVSHDFNVTSKQLLQLFLFQKKRETFWRVFQPHSHYFFMEFVVLIDTKQHWFFSHSNFQLLPFYIQQTLLNSYMFLHFFVWTIHKIGRLIEKRKPHFLNGQDRLRTISWLVRNYFETG